MYERLFWFSWCTYRETRPSRNSCRPSGLVRSKSTDIAWMRENRLLYDFSPTGCTKSFGFTDCDSRSNRWDIWSITNRSRSSGVVSSEGCVPSFFDEGLRDWRRALVLMFCLCCCCILSWTLRVLQESKSTLGLFPPTWTTGCACRFCFLEFSSFSSWSEHRPDSSAALHFLFLSTTRWRTLFIRWWRTWSQSLRSSKRLSSSLR